MNTNKKLLLQIRISGWMGVLPAAVTLLMFQDSGAYFYLALTIITTIISIYVLTTAQRDDWKQRGKVWKFIILDLFFSGILPAIPLMIALRYTEKNSQK